MSPIVSAWIGGMNTSAIIVCAAALLTGHGTIMTGGLLAANVISLLSVLTDIHRGRQ